MGTQPRPFVEVLAMAVFTLQAQSRVGARDQTVWPAKLGLVTPRPCTEVVWLTPRQRIQHYHSMR